MVHTESFPVLCQRIVDYKTCLFLAVCWTEELGVLVSYFLCFILTPGGWSCKTNFCLLWVSWKDKSGMSILAPVTKTILLEDKEFLSGNRDKQVSKCHLIFHNFLGDNSVWHEISLCLLTYLCERKSCVSQPFFIQYFFPEIYFMD